MQEPESWKNEVESWFSAQGAGVRWNDMYAENTTRLDEDSFRRRRDFAVDLVEKRADPAARILDLGCGAGALTTALAERGRSPVALDYAPDMLEYARRRLEGHSLPANLLLRGDASRLPFPDESFDCVMSLGVISYQPDYTQMLGEVHRVLRPNGFALITFRNIFNPVASDPWSAAKALGKLLIRRERPSDSGFGRRLDPALVRRDIRAGGLICESLHGIGLGPFTIASKGIMSPRSSIRVSHALSRILSSVGAGVVIRWTSDVAMFVCRKPGPGGI